MNTRNGVSQSIAQPISAYALKVYLSNIPDDQTLVSLDLSDPDNPMLTAEWGTDN